MRGSTLITVLYVIWAIPCVGRTITVDATGTGDYPTIQAAIDAANKGDTVFVSPGIFIENIRLKDGLTLQGAGADVTTIDGGEMAM
jgi:pectin methylesterase-like acyl-CoA thioesterase